MLVTAEDGGIVNDPVLLRVEENRWWLALADSDAGLYAMGVAVHSGMDVHVGHPEVYPGGGRRHLVLGARARRRGDGEPQGHQVINPSSG